jgi:hypothetical protein
LAANLVGIFVLSFKKAGRLKSSRARVIAAATEKNKKVTLLIFCRLITVD